MIPGIRIGTIAQCEVLSRLSPDRFLVRMNGRDLVMQLASAAGPETRLEVQVVDVRNNTVFARVLENEHSMAELARQFGFKFDVESRDIEQVLRFLKSAGLTLSEETVRKFLGLRQAWGDRDLSLAGLVRRYPPGIVEKLLSGGAKDLRQAMAGVEKFVINSRDTSEYKRTVLDLLHNLNSERVIDLQKSLLVFRPDLEHWLWKELKEQRRDANHLKLALLGLKRSLKEGEGPAEEIEALLSRLNLDNLRSVLTPSYEARFHTLLWKDEDGWREAGIAIRHSVPDDEYLLDLRSEFPRLGGVEVRCRYSRDRGLMEVQVGAADPGVVDYLGQGLKIGGLRIEVRRLEDLPEDPGFSRKTWKKIDLVV